MKKFVIIALFTYKAIYGQENNFKKYLSDNNSIISLKNDNQRDLLKSDAIFNQFIILGESHGAHEINDLEMHMFSKQW